MPVLRGQAGNPNAPQQHSQPSRKGKKAWRKNVDVTEVQKGLEDLSEEIIQGGVIAEKDSGDLFIVDTRGDAVSSRKIPKVKNLKADEIISARSVVPAVSSKKRPGDKTTDGILPTKRQKTGTYVTHKELARIKKAADGHHESTVTVTDATYDPWAVGPSSVTAGGAEEQKNEWVSEPPRAKAPTTLAKKPISLAANGKHVPAVPKPAGGYSYNPVVTDYMARLEKEGEKALEAERKRQEAAEADLRKQEAAARSAAEAEAAEARAELSEWDEDSAWEGFESEAEGVSAKRPKRKTPAQRNKVKRRKAEEGRLKHEAAMRRKEQQARHIKEIAEQVDARRMELAVQKMEMSDGESEGNEVELRRRQLGKFKLPEKDLELVLPDELQESLRLLKPEGNLLKDRYRSMLVRGKLEARRKIPFRKQAKVKFTEKWTHKDFDITRL
ncbi:P60-like protein [Cryphonectria parasitica EP155]|uniref:Ribosome biogenesis protein NOP53 n=1 Tax=Cryphonectria parasitica (strain ATCC 38755 / EP155) TaxID=660469 RepID=A0A9P4Y715_CRYP1|nr:P60-like protein [Cryphonectria parasitica EP155]KAF3767532.1 P60-like protein [Cryphonectria parasitica EP155]